MRLSTLITLSLAVNLGLLGGILHFSRKPAGGGESVAAKTTAVTGVKAPVKFGGKTGKRGEAKAPKMPEKFSWQLVEAADYKQYIANLRGIACPEETIRDIILADVNKLYAAKTKANHANDDSATKFWQQKQYWEQDRSIYMRDRELEREKRKLLIELLGMDPLKELTVINGYTDYNARMYPFLSDEKREVVLELYERLQNDEQEIYRKFSGYYGDEYYAARKELQERRRAELGKVMTPQELEEFELRNSQAATQLGFDLREFDATEQEFRTLYGLKENFYKIAGENSPDPDDKEAQKKYSEARKKADEEIKVALGEGRYQEYKRSQDYQYQELARTVTRAGLPKETAGKVYDIKDAMSAQQQKIMEDKSLTNEQRREAYKVISTETQAAVKEVLGEKAYKSYESRSGYWLRTTSPVITRSF